MTRYMMTQDAMEKYEEYKIEKYEEEMMRIQGRGDATQYPYLCEHCNSNETHGTNRFCDDCKEAGVHLEKYSDDFENYVPDPLCDSCKKSFVSAISETCTDCLIAIDEHEAAQCESEYEAYEAEAQMALELVCKIQDAGSAVNIARSEVDLVQAKLQKSEAMHDISRAEYNLYYFDPIKGKSEIVSVRAKLAEAEADIENAETALRAAQDAWVWQ